MSGFRIIRFKKGRDIPVIVYFKQIFASDQLIHRPYTELRHDMTYLFRNQTHVIHDMFRFPAEPLPQFFILCRNAERTGVF